MLFQLSVIIGCILFGVHELIRISAGGVQQNSWEYNILSVEVANSSNEELLKLDLYTERIGREGLKISGSITINVDLDKLLVGAMIYRSATGSPPYKVIPYTIQEMSAEKFLDTYYRSLFMNTLATCSDFPVFAATEPPILPHKVYNLSKCQLTTDSLPSYIWPGYYKFYMYTTGAVDSMFGVLCKVEVKN